MVVVSSVKVAVGFDFREAVGLGVMVGTGVAVGDGAAQAVVAIRIGIVIRVILSDAFKVEEDG